MHHLPPTAHLEELIGEQYYRNFTQILGSKKYAFDLLKEIAKLNKQYAYGKLSTKQWEQKVKILEDKYVPKPGFKDDPPGKKFIWWAIYFLSPSFEEGSLKVADELVGPIAETRKLRVDSMIKKMRPSRLHS